MKQVRPNGVMEDSPLPSPVTSPNRINEIVGGGEEEEPKHRKGVKRSLEDVEGEGGRWRERERERERQRETERERGKGEKGDRGHIFNSRQSQILKRASESERERGR